MKYVWCEDTGSGYEFWKHIFNVVDESIVVETKGNNTNLRKAVAGISDEDNIYYILIDNAIDNPDVLREVMRIRTIVDEKENIKLVGVYSFELALLSFNLLEQWVFAEEDELKAKRNRLLSAKDSFVKLVVEGDDANALSTLKENLEIDANKNNEQLAAKLLYEITRNTGFETDKGNLGKCFIVDCCDWIERQKDDICGLDNDRISRVNKIKLIIENSVIKEALQKAGVM